MDVMRAVEVVGFAVLLFLGINYRFLAGESLKRVRLPGVSRDDPVATPPPDIVARVARRGRAATRWSAAAVAVAATLLIVGRLPSSYAAGLILAAAAWLGQFGGQARHRCR